MQEFIYMLGRWDADKGKIWIIKPRYGTQAAAGRALKHDFLTISGIFMGKGRLYTPLP